LPQSGLPLAMAATEANFSSLCEYGYYIPSWRPPEAGSGRLFGVFASNDAFGRACHQPSP
jgi:hypothetical protein